MAFKSLSKIFGVSVDDILDDVDVSTVQSGDIILSTTRRPSTLTLIAFVTLIVVWGTASFFVPHSYLLGLTIVYIILVFSLGLSINYYEWEARHFGQHIRVVNKFHKSELWIDNKLVDINYSIASIGVTLTAKIGNKSLKAEIFRLMTFNCKLFIY